MFVLLFGPPAVGKMTVGRALCRLSADRPDGYRLFHNHMTIEPLAETFGHGTPEFNELNGEFRRRVIEVAGASGLNLVFTVVWALQLDEDLAYVKELVNSYGGEVAFVELRTGLDTRLERNRTPERLADKRSKRDVAWSESHVRSMDADHVMSTDQPTVADAYLAGQHHLVVDNSELTADQAGEQILTWLDSLR